MINIGMVDPITKGRNYSCWVGLPIIYKQHIITAYLRVGSKFTEMRMSYLNEDENFVNYHIYLSSEETDSIQRSGDCEIQLASITALGDFWGILTLTTRLISNVAKIVIGGDDE